MPKPTQQTVRIKGVRTSSNGKVTTKPALPKEWELQAAQVRALRQLPEYGRRFLLAGDQNAAKRGPRAQQEAIAAGKTPGEQDVSIYLADGQIRMIETKFGKCRLRPQQKECHAALAKIGHYVEVASAVTTRDAAKQAFELVKGWLDLAEAA